MLFDLDETLIPEQKPLMAGYLAVARRVWGTAAREEGASAVRMAARLVWQDEAPCPEYRKRVHLGASDGFSSRFAGDGDEQRELRAFLPRFHATAFDAAVPVEFRGPGVGLVDLWRRARWAAQSVYAGAHELLADLHGAIRLGLVTNGPSDVQREKLAATRLAGYFDTVVASCDLGLGKPHPAIFEAALSGLGVHAGEALMIGNDRQRDIEGAEAAGIAAIWVEPGARGAGGSLPDLADVRTLLRGELEFP